MNFLELLDGAEYVAQRGDPPIAGLDYDSRRVNPGWCFVAMRGETADGNQHIDSALKAGAIAIVSDSLPPRPDVAWAQVVHGRRALARLSANFYGHPAERLSVTGITGTNGKTTTSFLLNAMLRRADRKTALVGTVEYRIEQDSYPAPHTTPEALELNQFFARAVTANCTEAVMEVSSHALEQQRTYGIPFDVAVFTNLTRDHLDYHGTMEDYFASKAILFKGSGTEPPRAAVINIEDEYGQRLIKLCKKQAELITYGISSGDFHAKDVGVEANGTRFSLVTPKGEYPIWSPLLGRVNVFNLVAAAAAAYARNIEPRAIAEAALGLDRVAGRFERVDVGQPFTVIVDYAHTDEALRNLTALARDFLAQRGGTGRVITVFGCGGDRDRSKRPLMGEAAGSGSDFVILTSDNPRSENPLDIMNDAMPGLQRSGAKYVLEPDRRKAIALAIREAQADDIVLIAGKGHEKVQVTSSGKVPFDDIDVALVALQAAGYGTAQAQPGEIMKLSLSHAAEFMQATGQFDPAASVGGYSIDSRTLQVGELFFAVRGERLDGHDYVEAALARGAVAAVVEREHLSRFAAKAQLLAVDDSLLALQHLGAAVRRLWGKPLVGVTGSAGKTTTKEAIAHVLGTRHRVLKSQGNLNNHFGMPLQLLKLEPEHEIAVIEMGMSHAGEITALAKLAAPDCGVVTMVAPVHLEFFESIAAIARAKYELIESLPAGGIAVLNADDEYVSQFGLDFHGRVVTFGLHKPAEVSAQKIASRGPEGSAFDIVTHDARARASLPLLGEHSIYNALAAVAVGLQYGVPLPIAAESLATLSAGDKRGEILHIGGATIINDCYNSNPKALESMMRSLAEIPAKRRIVVAGEMLELGASAEAMHHDAGTHIAQTGIDVLLGVRGLAQAIVEGAKQAGMRAEFVPTPEEAGEWLRREVRPGDAVLLKASRGVRLERALEVWRGKAPVKPAHDN